jgi:tyrosine-protein kinase Etk/Wzc
VTTPLPVDSRLVDACAQAALKLGGPRLTRLGVTSALRGEGRTTIALALAAVQARQFGRRALLVDADFDHPSLGEMFGFAGKPGLAEVTTGELSVDTAVREIGEGVALLPAGVKTKHRSRMVRELLSTDLLDELATNYEVAIVDLPPLLGTTEGPLLAAHFGSALLVVRAQVTPIARIEEAVGLLSTPPLVLVNGIRSSVPRWLRRLVDRT